jgi:hypothetical protein
MIARLFLVLVLMTILFLPRLASAQAFTVYDAFTGPLSPVLWAGLETNTNFALVSNTETRRAVVRPDPLVGNRFLQLGLTSVHPGTGLDAGEAGQGRQRLRVVREDIISGDVAVTGFRTRVTMLSAAVTPCLTNASPPTRAMAHAVFVFFNDGSSTSSADLTGDVFAGFNVENRSTSGKLIEAFISRCTNAACSATAGLKGVVFNRRWKIDVAVPLTVVWDRDLDRFIYTAGAEQHVLTYGDIPLADSTPPVVDTRDLQVRNVLPHCSAPVRASAAARYDFLHVATETGVFP